MALIARWTLVLAVAVVPARVLAAPVAPASAAVMEEARAHYAKGVQLYNDGAYDAALVELERANALAPSYRISYSIGLVQLRTNDFAGAKASFERYLEEGGAEIAGGRKAEVAERLAQIEGKIAMVEIQVSVDGAQVTIDDLPIGTSPLAKPIFLNAGYHKLVATKAGYTPDARQIGFSGGDKSRVQLTLAAIEPVVEAPLVDVPAPAPEVRAPTPAPAETPREDHPKPIWIGWAITGALVAGAVGTGIAALSESNKLTDEVDNHPTASSQIAARRQTTVTLALVTDVLAGAALVAGGLSLYFTLDAKKHASASPDVRIGVAPGTVAVLGRF